MRYVDSIKQVNQDARAFETWHKAQKDNDSRRHFLHRTSLAPEDEVHLSYEKAKVAIDAINTVDNYTGTVNSGFGVFGTVFGLLGKAKDILMKFAPEVGFSIGGILAGYYARFSKTKSPALNKFFYVLPFAATFATTTISYFISSRVKNEVSNMVKFQARKSELQDIDNFIVYTQDQINEAKHNINNAAEENKKGVKNISKVKDATESAKTAKNIIKDRKEYVEDKERKEIETNKKHGLLEKAFHYNKLDEAKEDQEMLHKIIRDLNLKSLDYRGKAEESANLMLAARTIAGGVVGGLVSLGLNKAQTITTLTPALKKLKTFGVPVGALAGYLMATHLKSGFMKKSSAAASYTAQQDLLRDPHNFMNYDKDLYNLVSHISSSKGPQMGLMDRYIEKFKFHSQVNKDFAELKEYRKTEEKEQQKLKEALKNIKPTEQQLKEAERLQNSVFKMLDKMETLSDKNYKDIEEKTGYLQKLTDSAIKIVTGFIGLVAFVKVAKLDINHPIIKKLPFIGLIKDTGAHGFLKHKLHKLAPVAVILLPLLYLANKLGELEENASKAVVMNAIEETKDPMYFVKK